MGKYLHKSKPKGNLLHRVTAVLFCLTLFSTYLVAGLFARYTTSAQSGDDARVAKFSITGSGTLLQPITADLIPGDSQSTSLYITNNSEVAVEYTVTVTNVTNNLPLSFRMEKGEETSPEMGSNGTTFTAQQLPGSHTDQYTLDIIWDGSKVDARSPDIYMGKVDYITVTVTATQID